MRRGRGDWTASYQLPPETRELLAQAMDLSHMYIALIADSAISSYCNATAEISSAKGGRISIRYDPGHVSKLPYLAAHECGHLIRMYSVTPEHRLMPVAGQRHRERAIRDCARDEERMSRLGLPDDVLAEMLTFLHQGIVRQVTNFPADFRIERRLYERYPGLRDYQEPALRQQHALQLKTLGPNVKELTPHHMFEATNVMNAAYGRYMARLLQHRDLFTPYRRSEFGDRGREMADEMWDSEDRGYYSDVNDARRWAEALGLQRWFEWQRLDEIQDVRFV